MTRPLYMSYWLHNIERYDARVYTEFWLWVNSTPVRVYRRAVGEKTWKVVSRQPIPRTATSGPATA
jgi:hypothetical protein